MIYRALGIMSGSSLDGLDIAFVEFTETAGKWNFEILAADCFEYTNDWKAKLQHATGLSAMDYLLLDTAYGQFVGERVNIFIEQHDLHHKVHLIASHGHTSFHLPANKMTAQLGDGAAIAAITGLPVINNLRSMDVALGGQGAPIVPMGEKLLFPGFDYFLNIGGIANISFLKNSQYIAYDICAANRVLNMLANDAGLAYDEDGEMAMAGSINEDLANELNKLNYYNIAYPKSLANSFGTEIVYPLIKDFGIEINDAIRTYTEHICKQVTEAVEAGPGRMLVTGGGAFNTFLINRLKETLEPKKVEVIVPDKSIVAYKEALIMALLGILRWREEPTTLASVTGAMKGSVGGAMWIGNHD